MTAVAVLLAGCSAVSSNSQGSGTTAPRGTTVGTAAPAGDAGLPPEATAAVQTQLQDWVARQLAPGVMIQVTTPKGSWSASAGVSDKATQAPMTLDLQHRIGSVSKTFTTMLILKLVQEGKLGLDDPVAKYVDGIPGGDKITIRQLGSMTAGLPEYLGNPEFRAAFFADPTRDVKPAELLAASFRSPNDFAPGTSSAYSNANTVVVGLVVEKIEGKPFAASLDEKILKPYGLTHTAFPLDAGFPENHIHGYTTLDPAHPEIESTAWSPTQAYSAGQMISTVPDLTRWARILGTGEGLDPQLATERLKWERLGDNNDDWHYTFGIEENTGWLGHNGMIPGYMTYVVYNPTLDASIVLVQNTDKNAGTEPGINPLLRSVSTTLFPQNPVQVPSVGEVDEAS